MNKMQDKPRAKEAKPRKIKANDNPWYLLATLYEEPDDEPDDDLRKKLNDRNRISWNRYYSAILDDETRARLIEQQRHSAEELTPFSIEELDQITKAFERRCQTISMQLSLPPEEDDIDFGNVEFDREANFNSYLFAGNTSFFDATFSAEAHFTKVTFSAGALFRNATFSAGAQFTNAAFSAGALFTNAAFSAGAAFRNATFSAGAQFTNATFSAGALFAKATFSAGAQFTNATFSAGALFANARFSAGAQFTNATFSAGAHFTKARFSAGALFASATFSNWAVFANATFSAEANFANANFQQGADFVNVEIKGETSFQGAAFKTKPPRFFGAKLHEGTVWRGIKDWPKPMTADDAGPFIEAYERLKLEMDRLKKREDELNFFALELQSRQVALGPLHGLPYAIYGAVADYGRSYALPLYWLAVTIAAATWAWREFSTLSILDAYGFSLANALGIFGFHTCFATSMVKNLPAALKVLSGLQTILGGVLLFLFGLGIRNRFRMK